MTMTVGGRGENAMPCDAPPMSAASSSLTILTTCWPGLSWPSTSAPRQRSLTVAVNCLTTLKLTSASSSARRISRIALLMSSSVSVPRPRTSVRVCWSFSERASNTATQSRSPSGPADERHAVADREHHVHDAIVGLHVVVEARDLAGGVGHLRLAELGDLSAVERVVGDDQPAGRELGQHGLVVVDVARLVGVDEDEVQRPVEGGDRVERRALADLDAIGVRPRLDALARELHVQRQELARDDAAIGRQRGGHRLRGVAGVGADLEDELGLREEDERLEEAALHSPGEHDRAGQLGPRLLRDAPQVLLRWRRVRLGVGVDLLREDHAGGGSTRPGGGGGGGGAAARVIAEPMLAAAWLNSLGMTNTLFASPWASWGSICRYW